VVTVLAKKNIIIEKYLNVLYKRRRDEFNNFIRRRNRILNISKFENASVIVLFYLGTDHPVHCTVLYYVYTFYTADLLHEVLLDFYRCVKLDLNLRSAGNAGAVHMVRRVCGNIIFY